MITGKFYHFFLLFSKCQNDNVKNNYHWKP